MSRILSFCAFLFLFTSCFKDNSILSTDKDANYVRCKIDGVNWENSGGGLITPSHSMSLTVNNGIITEIHLKGQKNKSESPDYINHDVIDISVNTSIPLNQLECPLNLSLTQNSTTYSYYQHGFITLDELNTYNYNVPQQVINYSIISGNLTLETLSIYENCNKPGVLDVNGNCYKFTGSFNFVGRNHFNEEKTITDGIFKHKVIVN